MTTLSPALRDALPIIYHGTPMTPRAALLDVLRGRAACVSFYRPDDVEAVEAISPAIMFRQRRVLVLETSAARGQGLGRASRLDTVFRLVGATSVPTGSLGCHSRHAGRAEPAQRQPAYRLAVRSERRAAVAYGWPHRAPFAPVRALRPGVLGMDRGGEIARHASFSRAHGRGCPSGRQYLAGAPHDARGSSRVRLSLRQCGRDNSCAKRVAL